MTLSRRILVGGLVCTTCAMLADVATARARTLKDVPGCFLVGSDRSLLSGRIVAGGTGPIIYRTTGNRELDRALDRGLQRLAATLGVDPSFGFFDDDEPNAYAVPESDDQTRMGRVLFGKKLFAGLQAADPSGVSVLGVAAHEFTHIWQYQSGNYDAILGGGPTVKRLELNADFMAGFYLGLRKSAHPSASLWIFGEKLWGLGDMNVFERDHHGTPAERSAAAEAGFKLSFVERKQDTAAAFRASMLYVANL